MFAYTLRRIALFVPMAIGMVVVTFAIMQLLPGSSALMLLGEDASPEAEAALRHVFERCGWQPDLVELLADFLVFKRNGREDEARQMYNAFLQHPAAIPNWAIWLQDINPRQNQFREPIFEFH